MRFAPAVLATLCVVFGIAAQIPLVRFIGPAVGIEFPAFPAAIATGGLWSPTLGTVLLLVALLVGGSIYLLSRSGGTRTVAAYLGGETAGEGSSESLDTAYGRVEGASDTRVLGTEFYDSVRRLPGLSALYDLGEAGKLDVARLGRLAPPLGWLLSAAHCGRLSAYVSWIVWAIVVLVVLILVL
jgi:hypothetical protein